MKRLLALFALLVAFSLPVLAEDGVIWPDYAPPPPPPPVETQSSDMVALDLLNLFFSLRP
jgi:hypothetical protein